MKSRLLPPIVVALALLQLLSPSRAWMILLVATSGLWGLSTLWARSLAGSLRLQRQVRGSWRQVGDEMLERVSLANPGWAPAPAVEVHDHSTMPGRGRSRVVSVGAAEVNQWHQSSRCRQRGIFDLGPTTLRATDPFGIYRVQIDQPATTQLTVLPPTIALPPYSTHLAGRVADGRLNRRARSRSVSSSSVRGYLPGDSLRWIHWPASAHHGDLYIRTFDALSSGDVWIFLDLEAARQAGQGQHSTEEHGVIMAGSLAAEWIDQGRAVGLVTLGPDDGVIWLPPRAGRRQRTQIGWQLAAARRGSHSLADLLRASQPRLRQPTSVALITPTPPAAWVGALRALLPRDGDATLFLLDAASYGSATAPTRRPPTLAGFTVYEIHRAWLQGLLPGPVAGTDWARLTVKDVPWESLPS